MCKRGFEGIWIEVETHQYENPDQKVQHDVQQKEDDADGFEAAELEGDWRRLGSQASNWEYSPVLPVDITLAMPPVAIVRVK